MSPVELLNEQSNRSTAGEANGECLVIAITKGDDPGFALTVKERQRFGDNRAFNASAAHASDNFALKAHCHCGPWASWARPFDIDDTGERNTSASGTPTVKIVK
jgi:hypothetical protein